MPGFSIVSGNAATFVDTAPNGLIVDFDRLDNGFNVQINGVDLFIGGPAGAPNEVEFQTNSTPGQTIRFADGSIYGIDTPQIWQMGTTGGDPFVRLVINPDGTAALVGAKTTGAPLEPLELFNGLTFNTVAIDTAWNDTGANAIVLDQSVTGPTNASGEFVDVPCFASGTLVQTALEHARVEDIKVADHVLTYDHGYQPVRWIGSRSVSPDQLDPKVKLKPILIRADALGTGYPKQDLAVSQQHRILGSSAIAMRMFGCKDVLIPANKLLSLDGIDVTHDTLNGVTYFHLLFDAHEIIWANGAPTEGLFTGPEALKSVSADARQEIVALFAECCDPHFKALSARYIP